MHRTVTTGQHPRRRLIGARAGSLVLSAVLLGVAPVTVRAATFTVTNTNDSGSGSLRAAITAANGTPAADIITFALPGSGVKTIAGRGGQTLLQAWTPMSTAPRLPRTAGTPSSPARRDSRRPAPRW